MKFEPEAEDMRRMLLAALGILIVISVVMGYILVLASNEARIRISGVTLTVELANTPDEQARGLSGRESLAPDHGMLFVFDHEARWSFWMKNMNFPLDIIWFDSKRQAVFVEQNLKPCSPQACHVYAPSTAAMYVLEANAGFVKTHDIHLGTTFVFLNWFSFEVRVLGTKER